MSFIITLSSLPVCVIDLYVSSFIHVAYAIRLYKGYIFFTIVYMSWNMINTPDPDSIVTLKCIKGSTPRASNSYIKCGLKEVPSVLFVFCKLFFFHICNTENDAHHEHSPGNTRFGRPGPFYCELSYSHQWIYFQYFRNMI